MQEFDQIETIGNVRSLRFVAVESLGQALIFDVEIGKSGAAQGIRCGLWTLPIHIAKELLPQIAKAIEETESSKPTKQ